MRGYGEPIAAPGLERQGRPTRTGPVLPVHAQRGVFQPEPKGFLIVSLPGESTRAEVTEVYGDDVVLVKLGVIMTRGGHSYKTGDPVAVRRAWNGLSEQWEPISQHEVREREARALAEMAAAEGETEPAPIEVQARMPDIAATAIIDAKPVLIHPEAKPEAAAEPVGERKRVLGPRRTKIKKAG